MNIFDESDPKGEFMSFKKIGDAVQGTYIEMYEAVDSFGNDQYVYQLKTSDNKVMNVGVNKRTTVLTDKMANVKFGQIIGFRYDEDKASKKYPGKFAKIISLYADSNIYDIAWLEARKKIEESRTSGPSRAETAPVEEEDDYETIDVPATATSVTQGIPPKTSNEVEKGDAVEAIFNLAKTKKLTYEGIDQAGAIAVIEAFTGMVFKPENHTKIIIKLTTYNPS